MEMFIADLWTTDHIHHKSRDQVSGVSVEFAPRLDSMCRLIAVVPEH